MSTLAVGTIKSASSAAPVFQNTSGTEIGQLVFCWVTVDPSGSSSILDSFNVSSVVEIDNHSWTINFSTAASNANYATAVDCTKETNNFTKTHTTSNFRFDTGSDLDSEEFFVIVCGG
tara:strand:- start:594 stop:947 length:354 start_codon:yes stop_codon:yes gene_type:complete